MSTGLIQKKRIKLSAQQKRGIDESCGNFDQIHSVYQVKFRLSKQISLDYESCHGYGFGLGD